MEIMNDGSRGWFLIMVLTSFPHDFIALFMAETAEFSPLANGNGTFLSTVLHREGHLQLSRYGADLDLNLHGDR